MCALELPISEEAFYNKGEIDQIPDVLIIICELYKVIKTILNNSHVQTLVSFATIIKIELWILLKIAKDI